MEREAARRLLDAYQRIFVRLRRDQDALARRVEALQAQGIEPSRNMVRRQREYVRLIAETQRQMQNYAAIIEDTTAWGRMSGAQLAMDLSYKMTEAMLDGYPPDIRAQLMGTWQRLPTEAITAMVGALEADSPLVTQVLADFGLEAAKGIGNLLVELLGAGKNPRVVAREMAKAWGVPLTRALTISRTEMLRAHRSATMASYRANEHVVRGWIWHAFLEDDRTCVGCIAMHGTEHSLAEELDDHPNGRCAAIPVTPTWEEMRFEGMPDVAVKVQKGEEWFKEQPQERQIAIMGKKRWDAWKAGEFTFSEQAIHRYSDLWGHTLGIAPLKVLAPGFGVPAFDPVALRQGLMAKYKSYEALTRRGNAAYAQMDAIWKEYPKSNLWPEGIKRAYNFWHDHYWDVQRGIHRLRDEMRAMLAVSDPSKISFKMSKRFKRYADWRKAADEALRLVGLRGADGLTCIVKATGKQRAFFDGMLRLGKGAYGRTFVHEFGHWLEENVPGLRDKVVRFLKERTEGEIRARLKDGYHANEWTKKDKFIDPYMGKVYEKFGKTYATEVLSMGLEYLYDDPVRLARDDPGMFDFLLRLLRGL